MKRKGFCVETVGRHRVKVVIPPVLQDNPYETWHSLGSGRNVSFTKETVPEK